MVKLIVSDLDDTLLSNDLTISPANLHAIAQARAQGIIFTFATGRMFVSSLPYAKQLELPGDVPLICYNGALIQRIDGEVIYKNPLPHDVALDIVRYCADRGWTTNLYYEDVLYVNQVNPDVEYYTIVARVSANEVGDLQEFLKIGRKAPEKILIVSPEEKNSARRELLVAEFGDAAQIVQSKRRYLEITNANALKSTALEWLVQYLGLSMEEVLAIGDSNNDVEMLREAGIGVAVANAVPAAKSEADYLTLSNNEGGVAKAIWDFALGGQAGNQAIN